MPSVPTTSILLQLINESINSPAIVKHYMVVVQRTIQDINPSQVLVITADLSGYTLLKQIQWKYSNTFGKDSFAITMGGLHLEIATVAVLGLMLHWIWNQAWPFNQILVQEFYIFKVWCIYLSRIIFFWFHSYEPLRTAFFSKQKFGHNLHCLIQCSSSSSQLWYFLISWLVWYSFSLCK